MDKNPYKKEITEKFGAHEFVNSSDHKSIKDYLISKEKWGYDFTFDCTGNVNVMRTALEVAHRGWGESCVIGVAASGHEI